LVFCFPRRFVLPLVCYVITFRLHVPIVLKSGSLTLLEPSGPVQICIGIAAPLSFYIRYYVSCGPGSVVGIATGYGLDGPGIESCCGRDFP